MRMPFPRLIDIVSTAATRVHDPETPPKSLGTYLSKTVKTRPPRAGELCPTCKSERLEYDGMLNLACPRCGVVSSGCST